jgi:hypothetical protein
MVLLKVLSALVLLQVLSALMAAAWFHNAHSTLSSTPLLKRVLLATLLCWTPLTCLLPLHCAVPCMVLLQVLSALMAAAWSHNAHSTPQLKYLLVATPLDTFAKLFAASALRCFSYGAFSGVICVVDFDSICVVQQTCHADLFIISAWLHCCFWCCCRCYLP